MANQPRARRTALRAAVVGVVGVVATLGTGPDAQGAPTSVSVVGGALALAGPTVGGVALVTLDGTAQVAQAPMDPFSVTDARGSGQGWVVHLHATPAREWDGTAYVENGKVLADGSITLPGLSVVANAGDLTTPYVATGPYRLDGPPVNVAQATAGTGMGRFSFTPTGALQIAVPAHAYARTYRSELSVTVTSGP